MTWVAIGVSVVGAVGSAASAKDAAKKQVGAANAATAMQGQINQENIGRNQPFYDAGQSALFKLQGRLPQLSGSYDPKKLMTDPGYQFGLQQGQQALERSMAARGRGVSGAAMKAAGEYGNNYATTKLGEAFGRDQTAKNQEFNQLMTLTNMGQASANGMAASNSHYGEQAGSNMIQAGNAEAAGGMAATNAVLNGINQGVSVWGNRKQPTTGGAGRPQNNVMQSPAYTAQYGHQAGTNYQPGYGVTQADFNSPTWATQQLAEGGPVMTRAQIDAELFGSPMSYAEGGQVEGDSMGKADQVPVQLSGGEHIIDAEIVSMLGDGNSEAGHARLEQLKAHLRAMKRAAPPGQTAQAIGSENGAA